MPIVAAVIIIGFLLLYVSTAQAQEFDGEPNAVSFFDTPSTGAVQKLAQAIAFAEGYGVAGVIPTVANNPGDLVIPGWTGETLGARISVFDTVEEGWARLYHQLNLIVAGTSHVYNADMTISEMATKWTATDSAFWASNVALKLNDLGIDANPQTQLSDFIFGG